MEYQKKKKPEREDREMGISPIIIISTTVLAALRVNFNFCWLPVILQAKASALDLCPHIHR